MAVRERSVERRRAQKWTFALSLSDGHLLIKMNFLFSLFMRRSSYLPFQFQEASRRVNIFSRIQVAPYNRNIKPLDKKFRRRSHSEGPEDNVMFDGYLPWASHFIDFLSFRFMMWKVPAIEQSRRQWQRKPDLWGIYFREKENNFLGFSEKGEKWPYTCLCECRKEIDCEQ